MTQAPIFFVGAERSGTTLFGLMLQQHPAISYMGEFEFAVELVSDHGDWPALNEYYEWLDMNLIFREKNLAIDKGLSYPDLVNSFLAQKSQRDGRPIVVAKLCRRFEMVPRIWPDARTIHLIRDGRDVARSAIGMGWGGNVWTGVNVWLDAERSWDALRGQLDDRQWTEVRYEDLVTAPESVLSRVCDFIGIPFDPFMLEYAERSTYDRPDPSLATQWPSKLGRREVQQVEARAGELLQERGYKLSGYPRIRVSPWMDKLLRFQSRVRKARFHARRYGLFLWAGLVLTGRLGPKALHKRLTLRTHEIRKRHHK